LKQPLRGWNGALIAAVSLYLAVALDVGLSHWTLLGGRPDFLVLVLAGLSLFASRTGGAFIGFASGWLYAAVDGANMWQYVATRTVAAFLISWVAQAGIERNYFSALLAGIAGVLLCQFALMFLAPPPQIGPFLGDTIRTAVYNGVLATLFYAVLNRILGPRR
jgi:hypothetical protein